MRRPLRLCRACISLHEFGQPALRRSDIRSEDNVLFRRQPRQAPKRWLSPLPRPRPDTSCPSGSALLTRLVLPSTDNVSFSSSLFFRRVKEISALNAACSEASLVTLQLSVLLLFCRHALPIAGPFHRSTRRLLQCCLLRLRHTL